MAHWKEHVGSELLGAYSLFDDTTEKFKEVDGLILKTGHAEYVLGASGKKKIFVAYTSLGKPMKLNNTISAMIGVIAGSQNPDRWVNIPVTFWVDENTKFGRDLVAAIRVKPQAGKINVLNSLEKDIEQLRECKTLAELQQVYLSLPTKAMQQVIKVKDELKTKLK